MIYVTTSLVNLTLQTCYFSHIKHTILLLSVCWGILKIFFFCTKRHQKQGKGVQQVIRIFDKKNNKSSAEKWHAKHWVHFRLMSIHITWKVTLHKSLKRLSVLNHHFLSGERSIQTLYLSKSHNTIKRKIAWRSRSKCTLHVPKMYVGFMQNPIR